jgi:hypothetical protein
MLFEGWIIGGRFLGEEDEEKSLRVETVEDEALRPEVWEVWDVERVGGDRSGCTG